MPRYRLTIEYDGGPFTGWQSQAGGTSVQDLLERAVAIINGIVDALRPLGVNEMAMPASPMTVWKTIQAAKGGAA
jgi:tRNA pseudouridine38-40 synthase